MLMWLGFSQSSIRYIKEPRLGGRSKWTLAKRLKLAIDSLSGYSYVPLRVASVVGLATAALGLLYALVVFVKALFGSPVLGWASLMVVVLTTAGVQMMILGVLGEYVWRVLEEVRCRPRYVVESSRNVRASTPDQLPGAEERGNEEAET
jgi:dolichol-phosphate mannosyltransferase